MYDLVGDKIQEIFDAQVVDIGDLRLRRGTRSASRTRSSAACASRTTHDPARCGIRTLVLGQRAARSSSTTSSGMGGRPRQPEIGHHRRAAEVGLCSCRSSSADECAGVISLQNLDRDGRLQRGRRAPADDARGEPRASRSRTPGCSTRRGSARPSSRSSTTSARRAATQLDLARADRPRRRPARATRSMPTSSTSRCSTATRSRSNSRTTVENGEREPQTAPIAFGEGPDLADHREPRAAAAQPRRAFRSELGTRGHRHAGASRTSACRSCSATRRSA